MQCTRGIQLAGGGGRIASLEIPQLEH